MGAKRVGENDTSLIGGIDVKEKMGTFFSRERCFFLDLSREMRSLFNWDKPFNE